MTQAKTSDPLIQFLSIFGDENVQDHDTRLAQVRDEMHAYWRMHGFVTPPELFNALIEARPNLSQPMKEKLKLLFHESFAPEYTTGYYDSHRAPLVQALVHEYTQQGGYRPVYRIESDLMNLGGLNLALGAAHRAEADQVIGIISGMVRAELEPLGIVCPVRHGGDESHIILCPRHDVTQAAIEASLERAQTHIATFIIEAGLRDIPRPVREDTPPEARNLPVGTGVGLGLAQLHAEISPLHQQLQLEAGVILSKHSYAHRLSSHRHKNPAQELDIAQLKQAIDAFREYLPERLIADNRALLATSGHREIVPALGSMPPETQRGQTAREMLEQNNGGERLTDAEMGALQAILLVTKRHDYVTDLPVFTTMTSELLPQFLHQHAKFDHFQLLHVDFSNLGGGNLLGSWVGDRMAHQFAACLRETYRALDLEEYLPYLTSNRGGRFTALLPPELSQETRQAFTTILKEKLEAATHVPLPLTAEEKTQSAFVFQQSHQLQTMYAGAPSPFDAQGDVAMARICSKKTGGKGVDVAVAFANMGPEQSIGEVLKTLEAETKIQQDAHIQRRRNDEHGTETQQSGDSQQSPSGGGVAAGEGSEGPPRRRDRGSVGKGENTIRSILENGPGGDRTERRALR